MCGVCACVCVYQVSDVHDHDEERAVPIGDGELHLALHLPRRGAEGRLWCSGRGCVRTFCLIISSDGMEEGVDQVTLETRNPETRTTSGPEPQNVPVCVRACVYLCDLGGAPQQVVDVVVELQLPFSRHLLDVCAAEHHLVGETRGEKEAEECAWRCSPSWRSILRPCSR